MNYLRLSNVNYLVIIVNLSVNQSIKNSYMMYINKSYLPGTTK